MKPLRTGEVAHGRNCSSRGDRPARSSKPSDSRAGGHLCLGHPWSEPFWWCKWQHAGPASSEMHVRLVSRTLISFLRDSQGGSMSVIWLEPLPLLEIVSGPSGGNPNAWCTSTCVTSGL